MKRFIQFVAFIFNINFPHIFTLINVKKVWFDKVLYINLTWHICIIHRNYIVKIIKHILKRGFIISHFFLQQCCHSFSLIWRSSSCKLPRKKKQLKKWSTLHITCFCPIEIIITKIKVNRKWQFTKASKMQCFPWAENSNEIKWDGNSSYCQTFSQTFVNAFIYFTLFNVIIVVPLYLL